MSYLYHFVPPNMLEDELMPLNTIKTVAPHLYVEYVRKYEYRKGIMQQRIFPLNCLWNDVVFLTAVDPHMTSSALKSCGIELRRKRFFRIDPAKLDPSLATVWLYTSEAKNPEDYVQFDSRDLEKYSIIPEKTLAYYRSVIDAHPNGRPLVYAYVPHILYKGNIHISDAEIVEV